MLGFDAGVAKACKLLTELASRKQAICLIDGRAGSGKSLFAKELAECFFASERQAARVVHMDDLYPGWEGLQAGSRYLNEFILSPLSRGKTASWQIWDWEKGMRGAAGEPGNGRREFSGETTLIIEGCGSLSRLSSEHADIRIWIEANSEVRRKRFSERDGGRFDGFFGIWAAQEDEFYQAEGSPSLADITISN